MMNNQMYVTSVSMEYSWDDIIRLDVSMLLSDPYILHVWKNLLYNPTTSLLMADEEYKCIWCNSPNLITNRHCSQCGAPRGFILGQK